MMLSFRLWQNIFSSSTASPSSPAQSNLSGPSPLRDGLTAPPPCTSKFQLFLRTPTFKNIPTGKAFPVKGTVASWNWLSPHSRNFSQQCGRQRHWLRVIYDQHFRNQRQKHHLHRVPKASLWLLSFLASVLLDAFWGWWPFFSGKEHLGFCSGNDGRGQGTYLDVTFKPGRILNFPSTSNSASSSFPAFS